MTNLKSHVARHFDYVQQSPGAQFLDGDWFRAKYNGSLKDLLEEVCEEVHDDLLEQIKELEAEVKERDGENSALEMENQRLEHDIAELESKLSK